MDIICCVFRHFWPKMAWPAGPTFPIYPSSPQWFLSLFPWMKKVLRGKHFANVEEEKKTNKQMAELKGIKIDEFINCFEQWAKCLDRCIASSEDHFEGDWSLNCKNKYTIFINKPCFTFGSLLLFLSLLGDRDWALWSCANGAQTLLSEESDWQNQR